MQHVAWKKEGKQRKENAIEKYFYIKFTLIKNYYLKQK